MASTTIKYNRYCSVYGCLNTHSTNQKLSFFTLPAEQERRLKWLQLIAREDLITKDPSHHYVCEIHFNTQDVCKNAVRKVLRKACLPCLNLPTKEQEHKEVQTDDVIIPAKKDKQMQTETETSFSSCQTDNMINTSDNIVQTATSLLADTPRKRKLKSKLSSCSKRLKVHESVPISRKLSQDMFYKLCDSFLTKDLAENVKAQTVLKPGYKGNRYSLAYKMFCLNLYYVSPQAYRLLQNSICLPSRPTLKLNIPITTEINDKLMAALKMKVNNMSDREKQCSLVMNSMSLKTNLFYDIKNDKIIGFHEVQGVQSPSPAKHALVVLVRGIFVKWYQPIGFSLLSECSNDVNISQWIDKIILKLFEIGLKIRVCVSDLGSDLLKASKKRGISVNKTYFTVDDHKIYYIFDALHLIKLIRNNLMTYDFHFQNGAVAKYEHIVQFYEYDKKQDYKQAPKLTNSHVNPTNLEKMKVRYATQLLSRSVASGIAILIHFKVIEESARATVKLIQMINDVFDTLNSSHLHDSCLHRSAFMGTEQQKDFFSNILTFFRTLKLHDAKKGKDVTKSVKFIQGFEITLQSILQLHEDLMQEGYPYLLTRRLNQDIIVNLFWKIRSKNGMATEPTSRQFISAFRIFFYNNLTRAPKEGNCTDDLTEFLVHLRDHRNNENELTEIDYVSAVPAANNNDDSPEKTFREVVRSDYNNIEFSKPEKNYFFYVCGALLKKCMDRHKDCELLKSYLDAHQQACNYSAESWYLHYKDYSTDRNSFVVPPDDFIQNIERMEQVFRISFEKEHLNCKIGMSIYEQLQDVEFSSPCPCFPKTFLQKLFVRMRIYFTLVSNNKEFRTSRNRRKLFSVSNL